MSPNRVAAIAAAFVPVVTALASLLGAVTSIAQAVVVAVALVCVAGVAVVWLLGWQQHERALADPNLQPKE